MRGGDIENILNNSDLEDFSPSDEDTGDPPFVISPEYRPSSSSETDSDNNEQISARPTGRGSRGSQGMRVRSRGRARGLHNASGRGRATQEVGSYSPPDSPSLTGWTSSSFIAKELNRAEPSYLMVNTDEFQHIDYFRQYIDDDLVKLIVEKTNQTAVKLHGRSLNLNLKECYIYLGITMVMASVNFPNLRMYWENQWRVNIIASNMSRNRFTQLRNALKLVFDDDVTQEARSKDKLWKVRPLIKRMQQGCMAQEKQQKLCIDEMIVPFSGSCGIKQYCPGKPNPEGLKIFVLANPDGLVCDFHVYEGSTTYPDYEETRFGLGEKAVLTLAESLVPGHVIYCDRYFTSEKLLDELMDQGIGCSGTIMKNRIPREARPDVIDDKLLKDRGRGSNQVLVRHDGKMALTKWFDNKPVTLLSTVEASDAEDICRRWCKGEKRYLLVNRPRVIRNYNNNMGGVDLADRMLAVCPYRYRTKKWTQRFISHMVDMAVSNSWILYKKDKIKQHVPMKKVLQLRGFKNELGEYLIENHSRREDNIPDCSDAEEGQPPIPRRRGKPTDPLPSKRRRVQGAEHLPKYDEKQSRCRHCHYKKSRISCISCKVTLCLTSDRNCFTEFHS